MLVCQAFEQEWGCWPCYDTNLTAFQMQITFLSCYLDTGLHHNRVTSASLQINGLVTKYITVKWPIEAVHSHFKINDCSSLKLSSSFLFNCCVTYRKGSTIAFKFQVSAFIFIAKHANWYNFNAVFRSRRVRLSVFYSNLSQTKAKMVSKWLFFQPQGDQFIIYDGKH